jgi:hypothetical protein
MFTREGGMLLHALYEWVLRKLFAWRRGFLGRADSG